MYRFHRRIPGIFGIFYFDLGKRAILVGVTLVALVLTAGTSLGIRPAHAATTWTVTTNGDGSGGSCTPANCDTLRDAMTNAASGDTIVFSIGNATIKLGSTLPDVTKTLTIDGTTQNVTISGNHAVGVFTVDLTAINGNLTLDNLTVANSFSAGGLINDGGTVTITNSTRSEE